MSQYNQRRGRQYQLDLGGFNTEPAALHRLAQTFGVGKVRPRRNPNASLHSAIVYTWQVSGVAVGPILRALLPYLVVKRRQAELGLYFLQNFRKGERTPKTEDEWEIGRESWVQMKALNTKGRFYVGPGHLITSLLGPGDA